MVNFEKSFLIIIFFLITNPANLSSIELENKIPALVVEVEMNIQHTPNYSSAYNGFGEKVPLHEFILWDQEWRENVEGKLEREEQSIEIDILYSFIENWLIGIAVPFIQKKQSSTLKFESGTSNQKKILDNLKSENLNGLGDISVEIANDLSYGSSWFNRGGLLIRLPTGNTGVPRGTSSNAIGEGHSSLGAYFHFTWFPLVYGLRNGFRIQGTNELIGKNRETLDGVKSYYAAGNRTDIFYSWSIERKNIFAGAELHYFQQLESKFPTGKSNNSILKEIIFELGYGNLSNLEQKYLKLPWQIRIGCAHPIAGQNTPFAKRFEISSNFFF